MKNKFGETKNDSELIKDVKKCKDLEIVFKDLQKNNKIFKILLKNLRKYTILNMRYKSRPPKYFKKCIKSLIDVLYQIRCNLFHGRKNPDDNIKDRILVCLAYKILLKLFKTYLAFYDFH